MVVKSVWPCFLCALLCAGLITVCAFILPHASAHTRAVPLEGPAMQVSAGFSSRYRDGDWIPLRLTLHNNGPDFTGAISVNSPNPYAAGNGTPASSSRYQQTITLSNGAQKQIIMYVPI